MPYTARISVRRSTVWAASIAALLPGAIQLPGAPAGVTNPCGPASATAQFSIATNRAGLIDLYYFLPQGLPVTFYECLGDVAQTLGRLPSTPGSDRTVFLAAASWQCDRTSRYFAATTTQLDGQVTLGTASVQTMACDHRFALDAPARVKPGRVIYVRVADRWGVGNVRTKLCLTSPGSKRACRTIAFAAAATVGTRRFRLRTHGIWHVRLTVGDERVAGDAIAVGVGKSAPRKVLPTLLATGDSTMQGVGSFLSDDLNNDATVVSDIRPGFSISQGNGWGSVAVAQVAKLQPDTTVLSIGADEGYPMAGTDGSTHPCCDAGWLTEYTRRMRATMLTYARDGRSRVFVLTIAAPRDGRRALITTAVNSAIVLAAQNLASVRVLRMDQLFSPHGYSDTIAYDDKVVNVRDADGVHLNVAGTAIEARVVSEAVRNPQR